MATNNFSITFEIEPIVKLRCKAVLCSHNMARFAGAFCELKDLMIGPSGLCERYIPRNTERADDVGEDKDA